MKTLTAEMSQGYWIGRGETKSEKSEGCTRDIAAAKLEGCLKATPLNASRVKFNPPWKDLDAEKNFSQWDEKLELCLKSLTNSINLCMGLIPGWKFERVEVGREREGGRTATGEWVCRLHLCLMMHETKHSLSLSTLEASPKYGVDNRNYFYTALALLDSPLHILLPSLCRRWRSEYI